MARNLDDIKKELMALPERERARLAQELIVSLDEGDQHLSQQEWEAAWMAEVQRRMDAIDAGDASLIPHEMVMEDLKSIWNK